MKKYLSSLNNLSQSKWLLIIALILAYIFPLGISLYNTVVGNIAFWYDPARDLLAAWDNLHKITLIGPTSGIPGIFYGPYWIWFLSLGLLFSKNPRVANFVVELLPYYILFPIILIQFRKYLGNFTILILWVLFMLSVGMSYTTMMWNPHTAPVLFLLDIYLLTFAQQVAKKGYFLHMFLAGIVTGLIINFHISFGLGLLLGIYIYFSFSFLFKVFNTRNNRKLHITEYILTLALFSIGLFLVFLPTLFFEVRHGFHQIQALLKTFTKYGAVVNLKGLTKGEILMHFFSRTADLLHVSTWIGILVNALAVIYLVFLFLRKKLNSFEQQLLAVLLSISLGVLFIYLTAKNPVWEYHFISTEIIFLLLLGVVIHKIKVIKVILLGWILILSYTTLTAFHNTLSSNLYASSSLLTKEYIVKIVASDAKGGPYTVFNYSPSIYTFDYSYLFKWKANKEVPYDPSMLPTDSQTVYLILPSAKPAVLQDFINYRTPNTIYTTSKEWHIADGTTILKRVRTTSSSI